MKPSIETEEVKNEINMYQSEIQSLSQENEELKAIIQSYETKNQELESQFDETIQGSKIKLLQNHIKLSDDLIVALLRNSGIIPAKMSDQEESKEPASRNREFQPD